MPEKINFQTLFRKLKFKVIKHFFSSIIRVIIGAILVTIFANLFKQKGEINDFNKMLPKQLRGLFGDLNFEKFIIGGTILVLIYAFVVYFDVLWEEELKVKGGHYTKNLLLDKFRRLPFEEKQTKKDEVNNLLEKDALEIGFDWEHLPNQIFQNLLMIGALLYFYWDKFMKAGSKENFFFLFWVILVNLTTYFFTRIVLRNEKKYKKKLDEEWKIINKERNNITLIENMGFNSQYETQQKKTTLKNEKLILNFNRTKSLSRTIPISLLIQVFPFFLLFISSNNFIGATLLIFWLASEKLAEIFRCLWEYGDFASSQARINNFLLLPEKNDNLTGIKLKITLKIKLITFENVSFRYKGQSEWVLKNYNHTFTTEKINHLIGKNGTGKSTIFYLLLGVIKPQEGKVIIELKNKKTYNLHQDLNLKHWRENNVAYCAHNTLIEEGSTGQKQWTNIQNILNTKSDAHLFLFDEADNALDKDNQKEFREKVKELTKNKVFIYIKH